MHIPLDDDAVKRCLDREVLLQILHGLHLRLSGLDRIVVRAHERLCGFHRLLRHDDVVFGDDAWSGGGGFQPVVRTLRTGKLRRGFRALQLERLRL